MHSLLQQQTNSIDGLASPNPFYLWGLINNTMHLIIIWELSNTFSKRLMIWIVYFSTHSNHLSFVLNLDTRWPRIYVANGEAFIFNTKWNHVHNMLGISIWILYLQGKLDNIHPSLSMLLLHPPHSALSDTFHSHCKTQCRIKSITISNKMWPESQVNLQDVNTRLNKRLTFPFI